MYSRLETHGRERQEQAEEVPVVGLSSSLHRGLGRPSHHLYNTPSQQEHLSGEHEPKKEDAYTRCTLRAGNRKVNGPPSFSGR